MARARTVGLDGDGREIDEAAGLAATADTDDDVDADEDVDELDRAGGGARRCESRCSLMMIRGTLALQIGHATYRSAR